MSSAFKESEMTPSKRTAASIRMARRIWPCLSRQALIRLREIVDQHKLSVPAGDLIYLETGWYVTHSGLLGLARRNRCAGMQVRPVPSFCNPPAQRWAFEATVFKTRSCRGFVGYGDADPSNVSPLVHGAEMRVAETRAVNRALRKAYGIGICSVEEIGSFAESAPPARESRKLPPQPANGNGNYGGRTVRDRLCLLIRQHSLDPTLVKA